MKKHGLFYGLATSIGIWFFVVVLATIIPLAAVGRLSGGEFVGILTFGIGLALASNKAADIIDPEDWPTFKAFLKSLGSRGIVVFVVAYPVIVVLYRIGTIDYATFFGAVNGVIAIVLTDRHAGEKIVVNAEKAEDIKAETAAGSYEKLPTAPPQVITDPPVTQIGRITRMTQ